MSRKTGKESRFQTKVINYLESRGACVYPQHISSFSNAGTPDVIACYKGRFIAVETKVKGGKPSPLQVYEIKKIIKAQGYAIVAYSLDEIKEVLDEIS